MDARDVPINRTEIQEWVAEALDHDEDPAQLVDDYLIDMNLPPTVTIAGEQVALRAYLLSDLASYLPVPEEQDVGG